MACPYCARPTNTQNIEIFLKEDNQKILIVTPEASMLRLLTSFIWYKGYSVVNTNNNNSEEALEAFCRESPDVIVLDERLPDMDALKVCRRIRTESAVPIIILASTISTISSRKDFWDLGFIDCVSMPFNPQEIIKRINSILTDPSNL